NTITREEIAVMFFRTLKSLNPKLEPFKFNLEFNDRVEISIWAKEAVSYMSDKEIINGIGNNNFGPKGTASREQAMALTVRIFSFYNKDLKSTEEKVAIKKEKLTSVAIGKLSDSLVLIYVEKMNGESVTGSGFFYEKGKLATNYHVIENAMEIVLEYEDGTFYSDKVIITGYSQEHDLATLAIEDTNTKPLSLGDSDFIEKGENIYVIGSPRGLKNSLTNGLISGIRSTDIQINAGINPGNSGGALLNEYGDVIGVIYAKYEESENLGFAIPVNLLKSLDKNLKLSIKDFLAETSVTPQAPTNVKAVYNGGDGFYISWDNVGADYYVAYVSTNGDEYYELLDSNGNNIWHWDYDYCIYNYGYNPGDIVEYAVAAVIDGNYSEYSYSKPALFPR
ncbi:MAG: trypsin-like serine protease, partial [Tissierellia bacterium]|nr:trypsin-like serine protease [Tissierellia bacterium]